MSKTGGLGKYVPLVVRPSYLRQKRQKSLQNSNLEVSLTYPPSWSVALSPLAPEMERRAEAWLRANGVIHDEASAEKFRKLAVGPYANWPFPTASSEKSEVITKFLSLWIFYDDVIEERDDGQQALINQVIGGRPAVFPGGNAHLRCWWELGQSYAKVMSGSWLDRHAQRFSSWVRSVRDECIAANQFRESGIYPSAAKHLERRRMNIGMIPNLDFLEYQMDWELSPDQLADPEMKRLENLSAEVVAILNDIFGFGKDQRLRWCNLVSCLAQEFRISLAEAFKWVCDMHNARVRDIMLLEPELIARSREPQQLVRWLNGLHHIMYGFARWHSMAPRYSSFHEIGEQRILKIAVRQIRWPRLGGPPRLSQRSRKAS